MLEEICNPKLETEIDLQIRFTRIKQDFPWFQQYTTETRVLQVEDFFDDENSIKPDIDQSYEDGERVTRIITHRLYEIEQNFNHQFDGKEVLKYICKEFKKAVGPSAVINLNGDKIEITAIKEHVDNFLINAEYTRAVPVIQLTSAQVTFLFNSYWKKMKDELERLDEETMIKFLTNSILMNGRWIDLLYLQGHLSYIINNLKCRLLSLKPGLDSDFWSIKKAISGNSVIFSHKTSVEMTIYSLNLNKELEDAVQKLKKHDYLSATLSSFDIQDL